MEWLLALENAEKKKRAWFVCGKTITKTKATKATVYVYNLNGMIENKWNFIVRNFHMSEIRNVP